MRGGTVARLWMVAILTLASAGLVSWQTAGGVVTQQESVQLQRVRGQAFFEEKQYGEAAAAFERVVESPEATARDWLNLALARYEQNRDDAVLEAIDQAEKLAPDHPGVHYLRGLVRKRSDAPGAALEAFRRAAELDPADPAIRYNLGWALETTGSEAAAKEQYEAVLEMGFDVGLQHYVSALYRVGFIQMRGGEREAGQAKLLRQRELGQRLSQAQRAPAALEAGRYKRIEVPTVSLAPPIPELSARVGFASRPVAGAGERPLVELVEDRWALIGLGSDGGILWGADARISQPLPAGVAAAGDFDRDGHPDLAVASEGRLRLYRYAPAEGGGAFEPVTAEGLPPVSHVTSLTWVDADHDGDLDLLVTQAAGPGLRILDNLGGATFVETTEAAGTGAPAATTALAWADFDGDNDTDLYALRAEGPNALFSNARGGRFEEIATGVGAGGSGGARGAVAEDLDNDGDVDLALLSEGGLAILGNDGDGTFRPTPSAAPPVAGGRRLAAADLDNDGWFDLVVADEAGVRWLANRGGLSFESAGTIAPAADLIAAVDADGNGGVDVLVESADGLVWRVQQDPPGHWLAVSLDGLKNNRRGIGAKLEVKAGGLYQLRPRRRGRTHFGLGERTAVDVVRITWPNGIVQNEIDVAGDELLGPVTELERLEGSCPLLYTWDGEGWRFINEVLGVAPLGMPLARGVIHPADHDEYVPVPGEALVARDGAYELRFTEELREAGYLDAIRLLAVDHPEGTRLLPDEKFVPPPHPEFRLFWVEEPLPVTAVDQEGRDWTAALLAADGHWTRPFERDRYEGLATPHHLELELPEVRRGDVTRLLLTGWIYWATGSINLVVDEDPRVSFEPVSLQVPDGRGGWRTAIDDIGLPNAKNSTLAVDLTGIIDPEDPRVRLSTTLRLYWDEARYTVGGPFPEGLRPRGDWQQAWGVPRPGRMQLGGEAGSVARPLPEVRVLAPSGASIRFRGFSRLQQGPDGFETFDYSTVLATAPWDQHRGAYTRYGEVTELVQAADDRYVIVGTGDEVAVRFPASLRPVREGWRRDWLVYLNGWVKDGDPNTLHGDRVEPLPFHAMSGYPYGPDEAFPDDALHRAWQERYNLRPARRINPPLQQAVAEESGPAGR